MIVSTVTGGDRDYIRLEPESVAECGMLVAVAVSKFIPADATLLVASGHQFELRVWVGIPRGTQLDLETRGAIDSTP